MDTTLAAAAAATRAGSSPSPSSALASSVVASALTSSSQLLSPGTCNDHHHHASYSRCASLPFKRLVVGRTGDSNDGCRRLRKRVIRAREKKLQPIFAGFSEPGNTSSSDGGEDDGEDLDVEARFRLRSTDWRAFRARLVKGAPLADSTKTVTTAHGEHPQRWAHPLVEPERGCLLIANPTAFDTRQTYFNQAVIFLFEHDEDGSAGFILNRPTTYALGQVPGFEKFKPEFTDSRLYMGGDVGTNLIQVIHRVPGLSDSKEVISGVYLGGPNAVKNSVKSGESLPNDYRWFLGYCGWRPGQLEREVAFGVWYLASGSKDIITDHCIKLKRPLWRQVLELMGGEYSMISKRAYGEI